MNSDWKKMIKDLEAQGFQIRKAKRAGHHKVYLDGKMVSVFPATTCSRRSLLNQRATLRRLGANV